MSKGIRALVLSHTSELWGGAERSLLDVFDYWTREFGVQPEFILRLPLKSYTRELDRRNWKFHAVEYSFWTDFNSSGRPNDVIEKARINKAAVARIQDIIADVNPDVVMTNSIVCPWAALAAHSLGVPHVWFIREYGDQDQGRVYDIGRDRSYQDVDHLSRLVVANSVALASYLGRYIDRRKIVTLYNPFNIESLRERARQEVQNPFHQDESLKVMVTGNIEPGKGQLEAIHAVQLLAKRGCKVELCLIGRPGNDEYYKEVVATVQNGGLADIVHFAGNQANPLSLVSHSDVCIMASRMEAFGRVTFEYLALGKPVVGVNSGATPEMVRPGENGFLYESGDSSQLAEALRHYADDRGLASRHGAVSAGLAEQLMKSPHNIDALYERVTGMLNEKKKPQDVPINYLQYLEEVLPAPQQRVQQGRQNAESVLAEDLYALGVIRPLLVGQYLPFSASSLRPLGLAFLLNDIVLNSRKRVLEFGAGLTTVLIGRLLKINNISATVYSVEHDEKWIEVVQQILRAEKLDKYVTLIHAPLVPCNLATRGEPWYDIEKLDVHLAGACFDMVVIDGPPAWQPSRERARYPALPYLYERLSENALVFLDDADRAGEQSIIRDWERQFRISFRKLGSAFAYFLKGNGFDARPLTDAQTTTSLE